MLIFSYCLCNVFSQVPWEQSPCLGNRDTAQGTLLLLPAVLFWRKNCFLWLETSSPVQNLGGRGNLDSERDSLHLCKVAALKLPLPVTAHGTEVKINLTELRGGKKKQIQRQVGSQGFHAQ